jgi:glycosyltransferase involved in cell wall biosynthesis
MKLLYLVQYPIHYQIPLLRKVGNHPGIELKVLYLSDRTVGNFKDPGFGRKVSWDIDLLAGYESQFLPKLSSSDNFTFFQPFVYGLAMIMRSERPDVLWVHGYAHWAFVWAAVTAKKQGVKTLLRGESTLTSSYRNPLKNRFKHLILPRLFSLFDGFLCIGSLNRAYYRHYGVPEKKLFDMPYAVNNEFFQKAGTKAAPQRDLLRAQLGLSDKRPIILYASKLTARKRPADLLDAYTSLSAGSGEEPWPYLLFVGDGSERGKLEEQVAKLGWSSVRFLGFQDQSSLPAYYDLCDLFVLPSAYEPWGMVINEAMNFGKPIIVSHQVGAGYDLVADGQNGYVFPSGDVEALADCLKKSLLSEEKLKGMGEASFIRINQWSFAQDVDGLVEAIQVLKASKP